MVSLGDSAAVHESCVLPYLMKRHAASVHCKSSNVSSELRYLNGKDGFLDSQVGQ